MPALWPIFLILAVIIITVPPQFPAWNWVAFAFALVALILYCVGWRSGSHISKGSQPDTHEVAFPKSPRAPRITTKRTLLAVASVAPIDLALPGLGPNR